MGKSALFGRLTGRYATVSNYPGTTVAVTRGRSIVGAEVCDIIDTPGVNALEGTLSEDEEVTRRVARRAAKPNSSSRWPTRGTCGGRSC